MNKKFKLYFAFKGERDYVQGPDIFDAVVEKISKEYQSSDISRIKYSAHKMLHANADMIITDRFDFHEHNNINSLISFINNDQQLYALVVENSEEITTSNEYSEQIIRNGAVIDGCIIKFNNLLNYSLTEIVVSMNKYFLQKTVTDQKKWIVTKFEYFNLTDSLDVKNKELQLELTNNFKNKLTKSKIKVSGKTVGMLFFSLI